MMYGSDADVEWSDEEMVKSGSATAISDTDFDDHVNKQDVNTTVIEVTAKPTTCNRFDPVDSILDRIDAEIGYIVSQPINGAAYSSTSSKKFLKGADEKGSEKTDNHSEKDSSLAGTGHDNGLSAPNHNHINTFSETDDHTSEVEIIDYSRGANHIKDYARRANRSDLDSVTAQQVDEKFKEIMRKKKAVSRIHRHMATDPPLPYLIQYNDLNIHNSTWTQSAPMLHRAKKSNQRESKFSQVTGKVLRNSSNPTQAATPSIVLSRPVTTSIAKQTHFASGYSSDVDSVKTEDFESKFQDLIVDPTKPALTNKRKPDKNTNEGRKSENGNLVKSEPALNGYIEKLVGVNKSRPGLPPSGTSQNRSPGRSNGLLNPQYLMPGKMDESEMSEMSEISDAESNLWSPQHSIHNQPQHSINIVNHPQHSMNMVNQPQHSINMVNQPQHSINMVNQQDLPMLPDMRQASSPSHRRKEESKWNHANKSGVKSTSKYEADTAESQTDINEQTDEEVARNAMDIERESARIQREMEQERKANMVNAMTSSPLSMAMRVAAEATTGLRSESINQSHSSRRNRSMTAPVVMATNVVKKCDDGTKSNVNMTDVNVATAASAAKRVNFHAQADVPEISDLAATLHRTRADLNELDRQMNDSREKAEEARTSLMLIEFKRDNVLKELDKATRELNIKRKKVKAFDGQVKAKLEEMRQLETLGLTKDDVPRVLHDREALHVQNLKLETLEIERDELVRQLEQTKMDVYTEQQRVQTHADKIQQLMSVEQERDMLLSQCHGLDTLTMERDELVRQLEATKTELFSEQRHARDQVDELQEQVESMKLRFDETTNDQSSTHQRIILLETKLKTTEADKNEIVMENSRLLTEAREQARRESFDVKRQTAREVEEKQLQVEDLCVRINQLEDEVSAKDQATAQLREEVLQLQRQLNNDHDTRESLKADHKRMLQSLRRDTDAALVQLREQCFLDKQRSLESLKGQLDDERKESLLKSEDHMTKQLAELQQAIASKEDQIATLEEKVQETEEDARRQIERMRTDAVSEIQETIRKERSLFEQEREWLIKREKETVSIEFKRQLTAIQMEMEEKIAKIDNLKITIQDFKEELDEQKQVNRQTVKDKLMAVARTKEVANLEKQSEMEKLKEALVQEKKREIENLHHKLKSQEEELQDLRQEKHSFLCSEKDLCASLDRTEKTVVNEINEECRRIACMLGVTPRKVSLSNYHSHKQSALHIAHKSSSGRTPTTAALANLRACNEELRNTTSELRQEMETHRLAICRIKKEKDEAYDRLRHQMEKEKNDEMEMLKARLIKDNLEELNKVHTFYSQDKNSQIQLHEKDAELREIQRNLSHWKEETAEKFAKRFEHELSNELEKRQMKQICVHRDLEHLNSTQKWEIDRLEHEVQRLAVLQNKALSPTFTAPASTEDMMRNLNTVQCRLRQLQVENRSLRQNHLAGSVPDLSTYNLNNTDQMMKASEQETSMVQSLEHCGKQAEREAVLAKKQNNLYQEHLSNKMAEMSKLHGALANQSKDLRQLERAYTQLQYKSNRPSLSPKRNSPSPSLRTRPSSAMR